MHPHTQEIFTTKQLLRIVRQLNPGMNIDNDRLRDWSHRRLLAGKPGSPGVERRYTFEEMVYVLAFALLTDYVRRLEAVPNVATHLAKFIIDAYGDGDESGKPVLLLRDSEMPALELHERTEKFNHVVRIFPWMPGLILDPVGMSLELHKEVSEVLAAR